VLDPTDLYELAPDPPSLTRPVLIQALTGFVDAGGGTRLAREHLLETREHRLVATFDADQLLDYRSRRPAMLFVEDHWETYADPAISVHQVTDAAGTEFLLLAGPEPDLQWERFVAAVRTVADGLDVGLTVGLNAIPMAVPHSRPVGITAHASRPDLVAGYEPWIHTVQVPASAGHLLEYRRGQAGQDAMGFAAHVPHYLAQADYPDAAAELLDAVAKATGLVLPTEELRTAAARTRTEIDEQVVQSEDVLAIVQGLERQYDAFVANRGTNRPLVDGEESLPTADELGAELERFLAERARHADPPEG